jgi:hypothetical protein
MSLLLLMFKMRTPWKIADTIEQKIQTIFSVIIILNINMKWMQVLYNFFLFYLPRLHKNIFLQLIFSLTN